MLSPEIGKDIGVKKSKRGDAHIKLMPQAKVEAIGGKSLLDKQWNERPRDVLSQANKLTEIELCLTLEKIVSLPQQRFRALECTGFLSNLESRLPMFLTSSLVKLAETTSSKVDYFAELHTKLIQELIRRSGKMTTKQVF